jgi:LCP family protein required for cell wall assembly
LLGASAITGKVAYAVSCVLAVVLLAVSGYAYHVVGQVNSLAGGIRISSGGSTTGAMNILVMGLESRTDFQGRTIDHHLQVVLHSGSTGGQATNTLILLHIFAGGQRAVGFSIPRDDWVTYPHTYDGQTQGKIDQAYGFAYAQSLSETVNSGKSSDERYLEANKAGQKATVDTVEAVTGQQIDHFAEVNLMGYYYLAQAFGGVTVCVKPWTAGGDQNLSDANSGWDAVADGYDKAKGGNQYLHLSPAQSLAYVRDRDSLPNGDLDRTHRQQAVLDHIIWKMENGGLLSDIGRLTALLGSAKGYLITDADWNLLDFSTNMKALSGKNLQFYTAPITGYPTIDGQKANSIDIPTIQAAIKEKFTAPAPDAKPSASASATGKAAAKTTPVPPASTVTVDVYNGGTARGLATGISQALVAKGYKAGAVTNASAQTKAAAPGTQVFYGAGTSANATKIAGYFGATATPLTSLPAGHVEVLIGTGATVVPSTLAGAPAAPSGASASPSTAGDNGAVGGAVTVGAKAKYGVPCIY